VSLPKSKREEFLAQSRHLTENTVNLAGNPASEYCLLCPPKSEIFA